MIMFSILIHRLRFYTKLVTRSGVRVVRGAYDNCCALKWLTGVNRPKEDLNETA